ncbi:DUF2807 domain-containing protein [Mucilaginibacter sp. HMF5004]|uniref:head GIN domain-containing protein n=1 Tax=Mucilaginibacter rivuli TaxID=2857527 RepID=UPI001C5CE966|nr:head GIN domain-containing protein [Mucilaginibacter rivuli]MBW4889618.1 DUF2807 domain-containing protein [Mucilaginibacter rivuli]
MKKTQLFAFALSVLAVANIFSSCHSGCTKGSGISATETRDAGVFSKIDISGPFVVTVKQDSVSSVKITADNNLMKEIKTNVSGDKLEVKTESGICPSGQIVVSISTKNLSAIKTAGEVKLTSAGKITAKDFEFDLSGVAKINMDLNADKVSTTGSGLTDLSLTGQAVSHKINLSGSGQVDALNFVVSQYKIESSGATDFKINVLNDLSINSSGASNIEYRGNPKNISNNKSGVGSLKEIE